MLRLRPLLASLCLLLALLSPNPLWAAKAISIADPWARATAPGATVGAGYLLITNGTSRDDELLAVSTPVADRVELHSSSMEDGVMRMRPLATVRIPARATVRFEPGGLHLMLIGLRAPLEPGAAVPLTLNFRRAGTVRARLEVRTLGGL